MEPSKRTDAALWAVLAAALAARLAYGLAFPAKSEAPGRLPDIDQYVTPLAESVANHNALLDESGKPTAMREPVYPIALGLAFKAAGKSYGTILGLHCVLGVLSVLLIFQVGRLLFDERLALAAAALSAVYPPFLFYAAQPHRETLLVFLSCAGTWAWCRAWREKSAVLAATAAALNALMALTSTVALPFGLLAPAALFMAARLEKGGWAFARRAAVLCWAVFIGLYALWPLRNYRHFGTWVLGSTSASGNHFYMFQIVPQELGGTSAHYDILATDATWAEGMKLPPIEREQFFWKAGMRLVKRHPVRYARLVCWRLFWDLWRLAPRPRGYAHGYGAIWWVSVLTDGWLIPLGFVGIALARLKAAELSWIYLYIAALSGGYALVLSMIRYRLPMMPWFLLFALYALRRLISRMPAEKNGLLGS